MATGTTRGSGSNQRDLNGMAPAANTARLGDLLNDIITNLNLVVARDNALITALNAASGAVIPSLATITALTAPAATRTINAVPGAPELVGDRP